MAAADYRLCDKCGCKAFYDSNLNYNFEAQEEECIRDSHFALDWLGDWAVLCIDCAKTHESVVVERKPAEREPGNA